MDCYSAASDLKKLLVAHSHAESQVSVLGKSTFVFVQVILHPHGLYRFLES